MPAGRSATWSSSRPASTAQKRLAVRSSNTAGRSIRPPQRSGCSRATTRPSPQTWACTGLVSASPGPVAIAPWVSIHRGTVIPASDSAWSRVRVPASPAGTTGHASVGVSSKASSDTTAAARAGVSPSARACRAAVRPAASSSRRAVPASTSTTSVRAPRAVSARMHAWASSPVRPDGFAGTATSQVPDRVTGAGSVTGVQVIR